MELRDKVTEFSSPLEVLTVRNRCITTVLSGSLVDGSAQVPERTVPERKFPWCLGECLPRLLSGGTY